MTRRAKLKIRSKLHQLGWALRQGPHSQELSFLEFLAQSAIQVRAPELSSIRRPSLNRQVRDLIAGSKSQLGQDILALSMVGLDKRGYFVEFGATNGFDLSNTYSLEKDHGWTGIVCEPAVNWHSALRSNRSSIIDTRCVFSSSGNSIDFSESTFGEFSTLTSFLHSDSNSDQRKKLNNYQVTTVTLADLLTEHNAPTYIDFISIDTEGSEWEILRGFDFDKYTFGLLCVEHNYTENRHLIFDLLTSKGYTRIFEEHSRWDDWYALRS
jgi:FkbM family methyltransferase